MESIKPPELSITSPPLNEKRKAEKITNPGEDPRISGKITCYTPSVLKKMLFYNMAPTSEEVERLQEKLSFNDFDNVFVNSVKKSFGRMQKQRSVKFLSILIDSLRSFLRFSTSSEAKKLRIELKSALAYLSNTQIIFKSDNPNRFNQVNFQSEKSDISKGDGAYACGSHVISFLSQSSKEEPYNVENILREGVLRHRKLNHPKRNSLSTIEMLFGPTNPDMKIIGPFISEKPSASCYPWITRFYSILKKIKPSTSGLLCYMKHCVMCRVLYDKKVELFDSASSFAPPTLNNILEGALDDSVSSNASKLPKYKVENKDGAYHVRFANSYFAAVFLSIHLQLCYTPKFLRTKIIFIPAKATPSLT
jgi:hypothetical protein